MSSCCGCRPVRHFRCTRPNRDEESSVVSIIRAALCGVSLGAELFGSGGAVRQSAAADRVNGAVKCNGPIAYNRNAAPFVWRKREVKGAQLRNTIVNLRNYT